MTDTQLLRDLAAVIKWLDAIDYVSLQSDTPAARRIQTAMPSIIARLELVADDCRRLAA